MEKIWAKDNPKKILCVRLDSMGDVIMCSAALRALKDSGAKITLLTSESGRQISTLMPFVDDSIVLQAPWVKRSGAFPVYNGLLSKKINEIKHLGFDAAVVFTTYSQSPLPAAFLCYLAGIPLRAAYCRENPYEIINSWVPEPEPDKIIRHEVRRQMDLVESLGYPVKNKDLLISLNKEIKLKMARRIINSWGIKSKNWYVLHPGASAPSRRYPAHLFARVIRQLYEEKKIAVLTGTDFDLDIIKEISGLLPEGSYRIILDLNLEELAALIEASPLLITNNTGPAHLAAALKTPLVVLYALTNPQHTPWRALGKILFHDVPCKFCYKSICPLGHHACLKKINPHEVAEAAKKIIDNEEKLCTHSELTLLSMIHQPA